MQIQGKKRFTLFPPSALLYLYPCLHPVSYNIQFYCVNKTDFVILWLLSLYGLLIMYCWAFIVMWLGSQFMVSGWCSGNNVSLSTPSLCVMCLLVCHTVTSFVSSNYLVKSPFCCLTMCCCLAPCTILVMLCVLLCSMYPISLQCATYLCICLSIINPRATKGYCSCLVRNLFLLELLGTPFVC